MSVNRKAGVIYGSTDLWIYWDKADKLRLFYRDISHNLCAKRVDQPVDQRAFGARSNPTGWMCQTNSEMQFPNIVFIVISENIYFRKFPRYSYGISILAMFQISCM